MGLAVSALRLLVDLEELAAPLRNFGAFQDMDWLKLLGLRFNTHHINTLDRARRYELVATHPQKTRVAILLTPPCLPEDNKKTIGARGQFREPAKLVGGQG